VNGKGCDISCAHSARPRRADVRDPCRWARPRLCAYGHLLSFPACKLSQLYPLVGFQGPACAVHQAIFLPNAGGARWDLPLYHTPPHRWPTRGTAHRGRSSSDGRPARGPGAPAYRGGSAGLACTAAAAPAAAAPGAAATGCTAVAHWPIGRHPCPGVIVAHLCPGMIVAHLPPLRAFHLAPVLGLCTRHSRTVLPYYSAGRCACRMRLLVVCWRCPTPHYGSPILVEVPYDSYHRSPVRH
jgi:hypothetical protein